MPEARPPSVAVQVPAPEFEQEPENEPQYPDAVWAKIIKIELDQELPLEDLLSDNGDLFNNPNIALEQEVEWELVEHGANPLDMDDQAAEDVKQVIRRIETYRYIGPVTAENEPDCIAVDCSNPVLGVTLGDLIGANIAAVNLQPVEFNGVVPVPAAVWMFGSALATFGGLHRRRTGRRG